MPALPHTAACFLPTARLRQLPRYAYSESEMKRRRSSSASLGKAGAMMGLAFVIPISMLACWYVGKELGLRWGWAYGEVTGLVAGFAVGLWETVRQLNRYNAS
jgi:hypothetical protein